MDSSGCIVVLGAGITGLTVAWRLSQTSGRDVVILERDNHPGGLATTFTQDTFSFDLGSHRLHDDCEPEVAALIRDLCGDELIRRERSGLLYLHRRYLSYPPSAFEILFAFGRADALRFCRDFVAARLRRRTRTASLNFEEFTIASVGRSLYERFYKPYALKLYGRSPRLIAREPAMHRVRKFTLSSAATQLRRRMRNRRQTYLYPSRGIGQLSTALLERFTGNGGTLLSGARVERLCVSDDRRIAAIDATLEDGTHTTLRTATVISTVPLDVLHRLVRLTSDCPDSGRFDLEWRGLRLLYLITPDKIPSKHETFYFPDGDVIFGRVSELRRYSPWLNQSPDRAVLTIEIPCTQGDHLWEMSEESLAQRCIGQLQLVGILRAPSSGCDKFFSRRLKTVYPVYDVRWRERFDRIDRRLGSIENLYPIGRSGLFLHCNIDHCMAMALKLARHLTEGKSDRREWDRMRLNFLEYRVRE
ncbi:MAG TPA: FAD-dependent oxidoreductase [Vicinamibacterales bacterium]|nr:FAD-dependent oxidoreductase [Vicinamibacterales bacterium]